MRAGSRVAVGIVCIVAVFVAPLAAQPVPAHVAEAAAHFDRGRALSKESKYVEACAAFELSQQLDPQHGTLYNLAGCNAARGRLVAAWTAYRELARRDTNAARRDDAADRAHQLEVRLPRLLISTPSRAWTVTLNGVDVSGTIDTSTLLDPGVYEIVGSGPERARFAATIKLEADGVTVPVIVRAQRMFGIIDPFEAPLTGPRPVPAPRPAADPDRARRRNVLAATLSGGSLFGAGLLFAKLSSDRRSEARALCPDAITCAPVDLARSNVLVDGAKGRATAAAVLIVSGAAALGVGLWLHLRGRRTDKAIRVTPGAGSATAGLTIDGRF